MNVEAIKLMRDKLAGIREDEAKLKRFDLTIWNNGKDLDSHDPKVGDASCGFAGCILGWAGHEHWFDDMGFRVELTVGRSAVNGVRLLSKREGTWIPAWLADDAAFGEFLGVDREAAAQLIYPDRYADEGNVTLDEVIERIDCLLAYGDKVMVDRYRERDDEDED